MIFVFWRCIASFERYSFTRIAETLQNGAPYIHVRLIHSIYDACYRRTIIVCCLYKLPYSNIVEVLKTKSGFIMTLSAWSHRTYQCVHSGQRGAVSEIVLPSCECVASIKSKRGLLGAMEHITREVQWTVEKNIFLCCSTPKNLGCPKAHWLERMAPPIQLTPPCPMFL